MPLFPALVLALTLSPSLRPVDLPPPPMIDFPVTAPPDIDAAAWMVWSVDRDAELGSKNADAPRAPASITKVMTAILTVQNLALDNPVTISSTAASTPIGFTGQPDVRQGEVWTVRQLLSFLMVQSGNDAAVALAEAVAGTNADFVILMNETAAELGMTTAQFMNPSGLDQTGHVMSARDIVLMGREALQYPDLMRFARVKHISLDIGGRLIEADATDRDLGIFPGLFGLKTGDTISAGQTMLAYAVTPRGEILAVVLGSSNRRVATQELLAWSWTTLGPRDYFYGPIVDTDLALTFPDWYLTRLAAIGPLPTGDPVVPDSTPLTREVQAGLHDLLPRLLGGGGGP